jgi:hypothetical protein
LKSADELGSAGLRNPGVIEDLDDLGKKLAHGENSKRTLAFSILASIGACETLAR